MKITMFEKVFLGTSSSASLVISSTSVSSVSMACTLSGSYETRGSGSCEWTESCFFILRLVFCSLGLEASVVVERDLR